MQVVAITGASGFIGKHLVDVLRQYTDIQIRVIVNSRSDVESFNFTNIIKIEGDLLVPSTLNRLIVPGCTLVNLAYLASGSMQDNLTAIENLANVCAEAHIQRLVHCSTAAVVGNIPDDDINEETQCVPKSDYEHIKFAIERILLEKASNCFDLAILRPTAVFGPGGKNLLKLIEDIRHGNRVINYFKSCLYGHRRMNLVSIENVVSALIFLATKTTSSKKEIYFISDDENPNNNYRYVEKSLTASLGYRDCRLPRIPLPQVGLSSCLRIAGKTNTNPRRIYRSSKIRTAGFQDTVSFETGLECFADWYKKQFVSTGKVD